MLIGICYLMNPLQNEINYALHTLSHTFEAPNSLLSHDFSNEKSKEHQIHQHNRSVILHNHEIIDFINNALQSDENHEHSNDNQSIVVKIDKHLVSYLYRVNTPNKIDSEHSFWSTDLKSKNGFLTKPVEPPQLVST